MVKEKKVALNSFLPAKFFLFVISFLLFSNVALQASQQEERKKVLVLFTFRPTLPVSVQYDRGIRSVFEKSTTPETLLNIEFMDMTHFTDDQHSRMLFDVYRLKYSKPKPDLIIAVAQSAVDFVLHHRAELFPGVPVVFGGLEKQFVESRSLGTNITGYLTGIAYTETLDLALQLQPDTRNVFVFGGAGPIAKNLSKSCQEAYRSYETVLTISYLMGLPMEALLEKMTHLPEKTVVFHLPFWKDGSGKEFLGNESLSIVAHAANAPVYSFWDVAIGTGIVGGYVNNLEHEAKEVARLGLRILNGENPESIPIKPVPSFKYMVDWRQLKRWSISEDRLPPGSIVKFKELTTWDKYKGRIIGAISLIILQMLIIILLLYQRRLRRQSEYKLKDRLQFEHKLSELSSEFINLSSEEFDSKIVEALAWIGTFMKVDRSHTFRFNWDRTEFRITHLWEAEGVEKDDIVGPGLIVKDAFPWLFGRLLDGSDVIVPDIDMLAIEQSINEYQYCKTIGIQSFIILPIEIENAPLCAIGLDSIRQKRHWPQEIQDRLRIIGEIFANTIARRHSEKKSEVVALRYRTVADYTYDWEYWENDDGKIEYVSPSCERISGYKVQEFKNTPTLFKDIILPEDREIWDSHTHKTSMNLEPSDIQFRIKRKDGQIRWIEHVCQPVKTTQGDNLGIRASNRDITDRKQAEINAQKHREELTYISRVTSLGELSASMAHELNQPLAAILNNANAALRIISKDLKDLDEVNEILNDIIKDDRRASGIIKKLRVLMSKKELEFSSLNLNEIVRGVAKLTDREASTRDIPVILELDDDLPYVRGDAIHLEQVILNLILNGTEAMKTIDRQFRELRILTTEHDRYFVKVSVEDKGTGIDETHMNSIFETFYTTKPGGMGIGLSICRSIIEAHRGRLWAVNNPDRGATVSFTVPIQMGDKA